MASASTIVTRVMIEMDGGTVRYLEGDEAVKWSEAMESLVTLGFVHGGHGQEALQSLKWQIAEAQALYARLSQKS